MSEILFNISWKSFNYFVKISKKFCEILKVTWHFAENYIKLIFFERRLHIRGIWQRPKVVLVCTAIRRIAGSLIHICGMCYACAEQYFAKHHFDVWKIPTFLGIMNTEPNLLSLGQVLHYALRVICQTFTKCHICVAAWRLIKT